MKALVGAFNQEKALVGKYVIVKTDGLFAALCREDRGVKKTSSPETMQLQRRSVNLKAGVKHFSEFFIIVAHFVFKTF